MELDDRDTQTILSRLPEFKLSYESVSHKKVSQYDTALAIPYGKKMICWFSFDENNKDDNVCYCLTMNKNKEYTSCVKMRHNETMNSDITHSCMEHYTKKMKIQTDILSLKIFIITVALNYPIFK